ncbi:magnesium transporter [Methanomicrobiaceae archaeon CYW5]|uniref:magnesium/cobalt transporter CorA n=1 Tax=Methanovulcanius yangii TaxID=1789227 RepID=UPI0029CA1644|nr:magnesium/cobalt transporter CorA [Methanovulcanius yangii]MBT8507426.1 magnesium transporter [Methanovulcanius yangii]
MKEMTGSQVSMKAGLPPGTLIHIGEMRTEDTDISIIQYDESEFQEFASVGADEVAGFPDDKAVTWINITGLARTDIIEKVGNIFEVHPLILEDILNTRQRPKIEDYGSYIFVVMNMLSVESEGGIASEQVSFILTEHAIVSFQEQPGDVFDSVRKRIQAKKGRIRQSGSDYLLYALVDSIVDNYFVVFEWIGEIIEEIEDELIHNPAPDILETIYALKRDLIYIRKVIYPLREVTAQLERGDSDLINDSTQVYFKDVYDHVIQLADYVETYRDMSSGMLDIYLSSVSNRMNEVMKVLTIIATIFIPLTFIAGIYGMNFAYMPELGWRMGYPSALGVMAVIVIIMLIYFRRKQWI